MRELKRLLPVVGIMLFTLFISLLLYNKVMEKETDACWNELSSTAQAINREITTHLQDEIGKLQMLEAIICSQDSFGLEDIKLLHLDLIRKNTIFYRVDILFPDGTFVANGTSKSMYKELDFEAIAAGGEHMTQRKTDPRSGKEGVYYVLPVIKEEKVLAVLIGFLDSNSLAEAFAPIYYEGEINVCIIDSTDGSYLMDTWHAELGNAYEMEERKRLKGYEDYDFLSALQSLETGAVAFESRTTGKPMYMYYTAMGMCDWQLAIFAQEEVLFGNAMSLRKLFVLAGVVEAALLALYFGWNLRTVRLLEQGNREINRQKEELKKISYRDMLTSMYNRNKYTEVLERLRGKTIEKVGVAYFDLNGLKQLNDSQSHEAGDRYIQNAAGIISGVFENQCYRIGGDEFVVVTEGLEQAEFESKFSELQEGMKCAAVSVSVGSKWEAVCENLEHQLKEAEKRMYADKECYYRTHDRRR